MSSLIRFSALPSRTIGRRAALALSCAALALAAQANIARAADAPAVVPTVEAGSDGTIYVTAQRRAQALKDVPLSVESLGRKEMDQESIRSINDLSRLVPALTFAPSAGVTANNGSNISIRGLSSDVGSATTAIYIDDTPIQIRNVGYYGGNPYPKVFDLDRVEVLYGPQGTLFGASAEGGAVRFITPGPNYDKLSVYARDQISFTKDGAPSFETGLAVGAPITDNLAFRVSGWYQGQGGYIDQIAPGTGATVKKDVNSSNSEVVRAALGWKPAANLTITPSFYYQRVHQDARDDYWEGYGNATSGNYVTGVNAVEPSTDHFYLPAFKVDWGIAHNISLISNTSYFYRQQKQTLNYGTYFSALRSGNPFGTYTNKDLANAEDFLTVSQKNFVHETRLQSYGNKIVDWSAGVYYATTHQNFGNYTESGRFPGVLVSGHPQYDNIYSYVNLVQANDEQIAGYASVDVKPTSKLTLTGAVRYTHDTFDFTNTNDGPTVADVRTVTSESMKQGAWTPKFGITYKITPDHMVYVSATKGFRPGGAQAPIESDLCAGDLKTLGLTTSPSGYGPDSLWSYEAGTKDSFLGGRLSMGLSAYLMKWKNIQQSVRLPTCSFSFIDNLGNATGRGGELSVDLRPVHGFDLGGNLAYVDLTYDQNVYGGNGLLLKANGQHIGGPSWTGHIYGSYETPVADRVKGYIRADYTFSSHTYQVATAGDYGFDAGLTPLGASHYMTLRTGARFDGADLSLFIDNLFNSTDVLARNHDSVGSALYYDESFRPRTIGLTLSYNY